MIILLNGSINSGKSTIAKLLAKHIPNLAIVEIDVLREFIRFMPLSEAIPINLKNACSIIKNLSNRNINCVVPYPLSLKNLNYISKQLIKFKKDIYRFTLSPRLEIATQNRGTRKLTQKEIERIRYHYSISINSPSFGEIIDNSNQKPEQTAELILNRLKKPKGLEGLLR